jgi:type I restriction enzyme M protein
MAKKKMANGNGSNNSAANLGFEAKLWLTVDKRRNNVVAAESKHMVVGLILLKYLADAFEERHQKLLAEVGKGGDPEDPEAYRGTFNLT